MSFINLIKNKSIWIICILSFLSALFYNELNLNKIPKENTRTGETILTNDGASYLNPAISFHEKGIWREGSIGNQGYFLRPPGYGIFYLFFLKIADYPLTLKLLKIAQLLLFSVSVYWLFYILTHLIKNKKLVLLGTIIYGISPFFIGFLYYTLTEGISPELLILFTFLLFKAYHQRIIKKKNIYYFLAALTFAYLLIVRPQIGLFGIFIPLFIVADYWNQSIKKIIIQTTLLTIVAFSFFGAWEYRNYKIAGEFVGLHPIYYSDANSFYRPPLKAYWNFVGGFAQEGAISYSYMVPIWKNALKGDTSSTVYIKQAISSFPKEVTHHFGKERLIKAFKTYQQTAFYQKQYWDKKQKMPKQLADIELESINIFNQLTTEYKKAFWFDYHIKSPLKVFKTMAFHSNLSLFIFQKTYRGLWWMETLRYFFYALHSFCFLAMLINLFNFKKENMLFYGINFAVFIYVFYLCYFQRGIEERYTLPVLPLLFVGAILLVKNLYFKIKAKLC